MTPTAGLLLIIAMVVIFGYWVVMFPIMGLVTAKHFDRIFPNYARSKDATENGYSFFSPCLRGCVYAGCILFKNYSRKSVRKTYLNHFFQGYDFRKNARLIDWIIAWSLVGYLASIAIFAIAIYCTNGFNWP